MKIKPLQNNTFEIQLSKDELHLLHACVNEALELSTNEFHTRTGSDKKVALQIFDILTSV